MEINGDLLLGSSALYFRTSGNTRLCSHVSSDSKGGGLEPSGASAVILTVVDTTFEGTRGIIRTARSNQALTTIQIVTSTPSRGTILYHGGSPYLGWIAMKSSICCFF